MKFKLNTSLLGFVLLCSVPLHAASQQPGLVPVQVDPAATDLVPPVEILRARTANGDAS